MIEQISVLILTYNEAANIARTIKALAKFSEIIVLDSGSNDATLAIAGSYPNVRIAHRAFDEHATQWNYGLRQCGITRPWILALDADHVLSNDLVEAIASLPSEPPDVGYSARFRYLVYGRSLRGALYPPLTVLFRRDLAYFVQDGHTQRVVVQGSIGRLSGFIAHDDRKSLSRWFSSQKGYARLEAQSLLARQGRTLRPIERVRLLGWPAPILVLLYTLIVKRCLFDGWYGWHYVLQRTVAEAMIALEIVNRRLSAEVESSRIMKTNSEKIFNDENPLNEQ